jgi:hypothetical protein
MRTHGKARRLQITKKIATFSVESLMPSPAYETANAISVPPPLPPGVGFSDSGLLGGYMRAAAHAPSEIPVSLACPTRP